MTKHTELYQNTNAGQGPATTDFVNAEVAGKVRAYHASFPQYEVTPLANLQNLADEIGIKGLYVKDESYRFGLNAFKVLGGSYAIGMYIAEKLGVDPKDLTYDMIVSDETREKIGQQTFITATDGNHGRGVAWTAHELKQNAIVYMPHGSAQERVQNIRNLGAKCEVLDMNYDECVRQANKEAEEFGYIMVQDTAWEGYEDIPRWIIQGYTTLAHEAWEQMQALDVKPTHIFVQAGVGSLACAVTGFFSAVYEDEKPVITIVEPDQAAPLFQTAKANDGQLHPVTGRMETIMAGLACGEPCTVAWDTLNKYAEFFLETEDATAAQGMRVLSSPLGDDPRVISGESGAVPVGVTTLLMRDPALKDLKEQLGLDENSVVFCVNSEGDTDQVNYRKVVWDGANPNLF